MQAAIENIFKRVHIFKLVAIRRVHLLNIDGACATLQLQNKKRRDTAIRF
jgi:hypothetical protein